MTFRLAGCAAVLAIGFAIAWPAAAQDVVYAPPQPVTVLPSQAGYPTDGSKSAVVWAPALSFGAVFDLVDAATGRIVYSAPLKWSGHYAWGGDTWLADFSSWHTAGRYRLRVRVAGQTPVETPAFPIDDTVFSQSVELTRRWFLVQRSGFDVPGWHPADDLDDAATRDLSPSAAVWGAISGYRDTVGGWHDACDYNKWVPYGWIGVWALCTAYEDLRPNWRGLGADLPDLLDEAAWEADFLMKMQNADGSFAYAVEGWHPDAEAKTNNPWAYWGPPQGETDNQPHSGDERLLELNWPVPEPKFVARTAAALAKFGRVVAPFDRQKAEAALGAARRALVWLQDAAPAPDAEIVAGELLARLELDRAAADGLKPAKAADFPSASTLVRQLITWHRQHAIPVEAPGVFDYQFPFIPLLAMIDYLQAAPQSPEAPMVRAALQADGRTFERLAGVTAFGQMTAFSSQGKPDPLPEQWRGYNTYYLGTAVVAAELSTLFDDVDLRTLAQKQFEWVVGRNPLGVSMVVGLGWRNPGLYDTRLATLPNHADAAIPGGVINGIDGGDGGRPILAVAPPGAGGLTDQWQTNEYWVPNNSWFIYAATELAAAFAPQVAAAASATGQTAAAPVDQRVLPFDPAAIRALRLFPPQGPATDVVRGPDGAWHDRVDGAVVFGVDSYLQALAQLKGEAQALAAPGASGGTRVELEDATGNRLTLNLRPAP
ncbi:MAG TPA: glycoside hydrolase family 9 protein, partial [Limnochordia bacterium]|nr:glycoside hydrolase family 9 protein [Limnochordia bacterium]